MLIGGAFYKNIECRLCRIVKRKLSMGYIGELKLGLLMDSMKLRSESKWEDPNLVV